MVNDFILMNGYGAYVWLAYVTTFLGFFTLYKIISSQLTKEQKRFYTKFKELDENKKYSAQKQNTYKEIISYSFSSKI